MSATTPDLTGYDVILVNSSAGKDSQASLDYVVEQADAQGVSRDRIVVVHADLGRVEWEGTRDLAAEQAAFYGLRFEVVAREEDLLDQVVTRRAAQVAKGKGDQRAWPSSMARYCTSDQKTGQVAKLLTRLTAEIQKAEGSKRRITFLNVLGIRAQESPARAKKVAFGPEDSASNGKREVTRWLPIFDWTEEQVWARIKASGVRYHQAYDAGMPRLSCCFCVLSGQRELTIAARLNPALAQQYIDVEEQIGQPFQINRSMKEIVAAAAA